MNKKEIVSFSVAAIVLALVFGFDDGSMTFQLSFWLINLFKSFVAVLICMFAYYGLQMFFAKMRDATVEYKLWSMSRITFKDYHKGKRPSIPIGIILAILVSFISLGSLFFPAVGTTEINYEKSRRTGRKFTNVGEYESALIYLAGPLALSAILFICNWLSIFEIGTGRLMTVTIYMLIFSIIPIPGLDGAKAFTASRVAYVFFIALIILNFFLMAVGGIGFAIFLSVLMALLVLGIYYYKWEK